MHSRLTGALLVMLALVSLTGRADAKKFRYASGPQAPADSVLAVGRPYLEPVVQSRGPRVPFTNLQLTQLVADSAAAHVLTSLPLESGMHAVLAPAREHPLNFIAEHAFLTQLNRRGIQVTVRHSPVPDDSLKLVVAQQGDPLVEYTLASAKISYVRLVGWLPGRVKLERQALVQGTVALRDPATARTLWSSDFGHNFVDRIPRGQVGVVEDAHYPDLKDNVPGRNVDKLAEPIIVVAIVGGLVALFFQNRP